MKLEYRELAYCMVAKHRDERERCQRRQRGINHPTENFLQAIACSINSTIFVVSSGASKFSQRRIDLSRQVANKMATPQISGLQQ
uniref:Uncharacterized protein n=1 Tax=Wuchereria bancrofti TaxID=6293 RepID=A0A1I8EC93_WUCBA